ncbi:MAG: 50S ribosomal protein L19e [Candidatus Brockarchaeota archaeon]|nr:50S ribosomal protein L19e [Candidatus Brockarchaeota archaeon]
MSLKTVRRMAATMLKAGESRIWIDPNRIDDVQSAITRDDVRRLIGEGAIKKMPKAAPSRGRTRARLEKKRSGRRRGHGSRKGPKKARSPPKRLWVSKVRAQRAFLDELRRRGTIKRREYRLLYRKVKGGQFQGVRAIESAVMADHAKRRA